MCIQNNKITLNELQMLHAMTSKEQSSIQVTTFPMFIVYFATLNHH